MPESRCGTVFHSSASTQASMRSVLQASGASPLRAAIESLVPAIWLPDPAVRREREQARFRLHLVKHRSMLKHRIHSTLICFGHPCPVSDLFGVAGRVSDIPCKDLG